MIQEFEQEQEQQNADIKDLNSNFNKLEKMLVRLDEKVKWVLWLVGISGVARFLGFDGPTAVTKAAEIGHNFMK